MTLDFDEFFKSTYSDTVRGLQRDGSRREEAKDAAQEAYVRAYARWWRICHYKEPAAWVRRVAVNIVRDEHRKTVTQTNALPRMAVVPVLAGPDTTEEFDDMVEPLPPRQKSAVKLFYRDGFSTDEGAARMGISPGAFRFHLSRARKALAPQIAEPVNYQEVS